MTAGLLCGLVALSIRLSVSILLSMLQTELMAHFKCLTYGPHNAHGLRLTGEVRKEERARQKIWNREFELKGQCTEKKYSTIAASNLTDQFLLSASRQ